MANMYLKVFYVLSQQENENQNGPKNPLLSEWHSLKRTNATNASDNPYTLIYCWCKHKLKKTL